MRNKEGRGISIKTLALVAGVVAGLISVALFGSLFLLAGRFNDVQASTTNYLSWKQKALEVKDASDYLTDQVRYYVFNKHKVYMDNYFHEANIEKRRDKAIDMIESYLPNTKARDGLYAAVAKSNALMEDEIYAMRLIVETLHVDMDDTWPIEIRNAYLSQEDLALPDQEKEALAYNYVIGDKYLADKDFIIQKVNESVSEIDTMMEKEVINSTTGMSQILIAQQILIGLNLLIMGLSIFFIFNYLIKPVDEAVKRLKNGGFMHVSGVREYRYLADIYNDVKERSNNVQEKLLYESEHDKLTGLFNRTGYVSIYRRSKLENCYYVLIDIDFFKKVNDVYGHEMGDKVLVKVAEAITHVFHGDKESAFRLGGDEFALLIEHKNDITVEELCAKCELVTESINEKAAHLPEISLSIGIAEGTKTDTTDTLFKKADTALYQSKNKGRHAISVY